MKNNLVHRNDMMLICSNVRDTIDSITFLARHQLFQDLGVKDEISRFKERSLWLRSSLLLKKDDFNTVNVLVSNIDDIYKNRIKEYICEMNEYNADFDRMVWSNKDVNIVCVGEAATRWSELTDSFLKTYVDKNVLHVDRYDNWLLWILSDDVIKASLNLNDKAFVNSLTEDFKKNNEEDDYFPMPLQYVISWKKSYEDIMQYIQSLPDKKYLLKLSVWSFGSQVVGIDESNKIKIKEIVSLHNAILDKGKFCSLIVAEKIEKHNNKEKYTSPCVIWRIISNDDISIVQSSEQVFSQDNEYIWSYWNKQKELDFFNAFWKSKIDNFLKYIHKTSGYVWYIGLDFVRSKDGEYRFIWDINARMNASDDLFFLRKMTEWSFDIVDAIMSDLTDLDIQKLAKFKFDTKICSWLIILPDIDEEIIDHPKAVGIFINTSKSPLFNEYQSLFL